MTYWIITMDEKGRITIPKEGIKNNPHGLGQGISHTYSYLYVRETYKSMGYKMGLDNENRKTDDIQTEKP